MTCEAIQSVIDQTYPDIEIIVVDDGSTDDLKERLEAFGSGIRYVFQEKSGKSAARNAGIRVATGEYIAFLDSDDLFVPDKIEAQVRILEQNPDFGMSFSDYVVEDPEGQEEIVAIRGLLNWVYPRIIFSCPIATPTVLIRAQTLACAGLFDESMHQFEDGDLWRRVSRVTQLIGIPRPLTRVRKHSGNAVRDPEDVVNGLVSLLSKAFRDDPNLFRVSGRRRAAYLHISFGFEAFRDCRDSGFRMWPVYRRCIRRHFVEAIKHDPRRLACLPMLAITFSNERILLCVSRVMTRVASSGLSFQRLLNFMFGED